MRVHNNSLRAGDRVVAGDYGSDFTTWERCTVAARLAAWGYAPRKVPTGASISLPFRIRQMLKGQQ